LKNRKGKITMIKIKNLEFSYGNKKIFENFNLEIPDGQTCLVTGINGVGKSTLLRLIAGVLLPDSGKITFGSAMPADPRFKIGFISDKISLYESLEVSKMIELHMRMYKIKKFDYSLLKHTKIKMNQKVKELSWGHRTILLLSLVLAIEPKVLLIDEVIHSIDAYLRKIFLEKIITLISERKVTVVMVNLNFHDVEHIADRVILLKDGKIAVDSDLDNLKAKVKKVVSAEPLDGVPVILSLSGEDSTEYFIYPYDAKEHKKAVKGRVMDMDLTEIVTAFIGGEYV
jgi:ABC-type multidrug transport system ATPase subunit